MTTFSSPPSNVSRRPQKLVNKAWFWVVVVSLGGLSGWGLFYYSPPAPLARVPSDPPALPLTLSATTAQSTENTQDYTDPLWKWQAALDAAIKRQDSSVAADILQKIAAFYYQNNDLEKAIDYWQQARKRLHEALVKQDSLTLKQQLTDLLEKLSAAQQQHKQFQAAWDSLNEAYQWRQHLLGLNSNTENYQALQQTYQKFTQLWQNAQVH